jgi:activating signal cointegrator 1
MKALSIRQPWATLLCLGIKRYETRTWKTDYRGPIALHAGTVFDATARNLCLTPALADLLRKAGYYNPRSLPRGQIIGTAVLADCIPTEKLRALSAKQRRLGDFNHGRWAWRFTDIKRLKRPLPAKGQLSLFNVDLDALPEKAWPLFASQGEMF